MLRAAAGASVSGGGGGVVLNATFTGPDNPSAVPNADTGQVWHTDSGTWGVISNQLYCSSSPADNHGFYDVGVSNGTIVATLATVVQSTALCFRYQDASNHWLLNVGAGNAWTIYQRNGGTYGGIFTPAVPVAANGDQLKVALNGTSVTVYINGVQLWTGTSSFLQTATKVGFRAESTASRWDNLTVTT